MSLRKLPWGTVALDYKYILVERNEGLGIVTLNRPKVLNALNMGLMRELAAAVTELEDEDEIAALIITGSGDRAFSSGGDIHEMAGREDGSDTSAPDQERAKYMWHIASCKKPTIGAINGLAYGGGALMASTFDIRVGGENTSFRFLGASYGRVNSTWSLPMQVGWPVAKELLFTGREVEAREAFQIGLLNHLVAADHLMSKAIGVGKQIAANDSRIVRGVKELMVGNVGAAWDEMFRRELEAQQGELKPAPVGEGFKDFLDRKGPKDR